MATEETAEKFSSGLKSEKNPAIVALDRLGGLLGGWAGAEKPSAKGRNEIAGKAAKVGWT